jgi:hypothetical protein
MPFLPNILPNISAALFQGDSHTALSSEAGAGKDQFDQMMTEALTVAANGKGKPTQGNHQSDRTGKDLTSLYSKSSTYIRSAPSAASPATPLKTAPNPAQANQTAQPPHLVPQVTTVGRWVPNASFNNLAPVTEPTNQSPNSGRVATGKSEASASPAKVPEGATPATMGGTSPAEINAMMLPPAPAPLPISAANTLTQELKSTEEVTVVSIAAIGLPMPSGGKIIGTSTSILPGQDRLKNHLAEAVAPTISKGTEQNGAVAAKLNNLGAASATTANIAGLTPVSGQTVPLTETAGVETDSGKLTSNPMEPSSPAGLSLFSGSSPGDQGPAPSISDGTPTALVVEVMNTDGKTEKTADPTGNILPGSVAGVLHGNALPTEAVQMASSAAASTLISNGTSAVNASATDGAAVLSLSDNQLQAMERTHDLVAAHAMRLDNVDSSTLTVVIKPGGGTQLSLELRQHGDGIEAQAALQQGDYHHLNQNWPELQQRLEQRGIRLAPLVDDGTATNGGGQQFQQQSNRPGETMSALGFGKTQTVTLAQPTVTANAGMGWETWA